MGKNGGGGGGGGELGECREIIVKTQIRLRRQCCDMIVSEITVGAKHKFVFKKRKEKKKGGRGREGGEGRVEENKVGVG